MKKYTYSLLTALFIFNGVVPYNVHAQSKDPMEPLSIEELSQSGKIDREFRAAKSIKLPVANTTPVIQEELPSTSSEQALNVIKKENQDKSIDLEFEEGNLENILRTISDIAEVNIVLDPSLKNTTASLHLKHVKISEALNILASSYNLGFKKIGDSLFVTTKERLRSDNLTTRVIKLRYLKAMDVKGMTKNLLETINVGEDSNTLVAVGTSEEIKRVEDLVKKVDVAQPQVVLEAKIIEINKDALRDLGVDWSDAIQQSFQETGRPATQPNVSTAAGSVFKVHSFSRTPLQFDTIIHMLENNNKAKVLSNPRIITINNQSSEIFVGDRIPYTITTVTGGVASTEVRFVEPGIRLKVTPSIIDKDFVVIKIEPEVSFIFGFRGPQDQYPWVKTRNATAYVRIENNHPFILGGLLNQEDKKNLFKVPVLGSMPLLGNLFSYKTHSVTDSELIITVVPVIINQ